MKSRITENNKILSLEDKIILLYGIGKVDLAIKLINVENKYTFNVCLMF